jgi:hypothetical protein
VTDFGTVNVMLSPFVPQDAILAVALSECKPVYLEVPGKGHFFAEPLAKTGASDEVQLYGEVGLAYGNERDHGSSPASRSDPPEAPHLHTERGAIVTNPANHRRP